MKYGPPTHFNSKPGKLCSILEWIADILVGLPSPDPNHK